MDVDYEDALAYPIRGENVGVRYLLAGGVPALLAVAVVFVTFLSLVLPFFGLLNFLLYPVGLVVMVVWTGYFVGVIRATLDGKQDPPAFDDWGGLARDGLYGFAIGLVYSIPLFVLFALGIVGFFVLVGGTAAFGGGETESLFAVFGVVSILLFGVLTLVSMVYSLAVGYLYPLSLCGYATEGTLAAGFSRERLWQLARNGDYALSWVAVSMVSFAIQSFVGLLATVLIGYLLYPLLPFAYFFLGTAAYYVFAQVYADELDASAATPA